MAKNPKATNIGGDDFWPLNVEQIERFAKAATEANEPEEELTGLTLLYSGQRNAAFHHMRASWLEYSDEGKLRIVVPYEEDCTGGAGATGPNNDAGANLHARGSPCGRCRDDTPNWVGKGTEEGKDYHDEKWHPKTEASGGRPIPIRDDGTIEILEWWFDHNDGVPFLHNGVNNRIRNICDRAGIEREVTAHDLRTTFATMLARRRFDRRYVSDVMGHAETASTDPYYKFVGADIEDEFDARW